MLQHLTESLFDYAGLYPPAALGVKEMLRVAAGLHKNLSFPNIINSHLVVETKHLEEISSETLKNAAFDINSKIKVTLLGHPEALSGSWKTTLETFATWSNKLKAAGWKIILSSFEWRESNVLQSPFPEEALLEMLANDSTTKIAIEPKVTAHNIGSICEYLQKIRNIKPSLKVRCGGEAPIDPKLLSLTLHTAAKSEIPIKATAGLHNALSGKYLHGFLNVAVAQVIARRYKQNIELSQIEEIIVSKDISDFKWNTSLGFKDLQLSEQELKNILLNCPLHIGCCDLRDPDQELSNISKLRHYSRY